jgi:hypothetical protein
MRDNKSSKLTENVMIASDHNIGNFFYNSTNRFRYL